MFLTGRGRYGRLTYPARRPFTPSAPVEPLTAQFWVDSQTTVAATLRNGSISAPFASIQAAYDAAATLALDSVQIIVARSESTESVVFGSAIACTVAALNNSPSFGFGSDYQAQINNIDVTAGTLAIVGFIILGNITSTVVAISINDCVHLGNISASGQVLLERATLCGAGGTVDIGGTITFLDEQSEFTTLVSSGQAWVDVSPDVRSNGGGPNTAGLFGDANQGETFSGTRSRFIWPANTITAQRTVTLSVGGGGDFVTGYIDVYPQTFDVIIQDSVGPSTLVTVLAGVGPRRYGFQLPDGTSWVNFRSEKI